MEYSSEVLRRFGSPQPASELGKGAPGRVVAGEAEDRTLHVWVRFQLQVIEGVIQAVRFQVYGCPHTVAAASWAAEWLEGRPVESSSGLNVRELEAALNVPVDKLGKLLRIEDAVLACWRAWCDKDVVKDD
ncbi:MAG TPA: iron-sulfur cluster assembly scaffold protein [Gammaproteobacteria bacterium]|nr:iron-sulfur cluster assembly scaffold protein [Gammaproteobacteria bacterium]